MSRSVASRIRGRLALALVLLVWTASAAGAAEPKRVLIVHSFGSGTPPFTTHSTAFATTLIEEMGERVDLDEISLGMARYAQPEMEEAFVEFLLKRVARWHPDLVAPVGSPASRFVQKYRERLFPQTPIVYTGLDRRTLPPDAFDRKNATFVGEQFNLASLVEDILQLAPETNNIVVVIGASPLEQYWRDQFARAFQPFADRVTFTWLHELSFDQMLTRVSALPPRSFILLALLVRDATGVTHNQDEALQRLHAVASAPINGLFQNQLGLGIVGGRLYQAEAQGAQSARIAVRILRGEPVSSFPPLIIPPQGPRYDWRELQRWNISERRLPPGSEVAFREPTVWERYRWWILGALAVGVAQAGLIVLLLVNLARRRRAETALRDSEARVNLAADSAGAGLWSLDLATGRMWATPRFRELLQLEAAEPLDYRRLLTAIHAEDREHVRRAFEGVAPELPNLEFRVRGTDGPLRWVGARGHLENGTGTGGRWSGAAVEITERKVAEERLRESESRFRTIADSAPVFIWMSERDGTCVFRNKPWLDFTGRSAEQELGDGWAEGVHPDDRPRCLKAHAQARDTRRPFMVQYRVRRHDGEFRWVSDNGVPRHDAQGRFAGFIGSCSDITERLRAEDKFRQVFEAASNGMIMVDDHGIIGLVNVQVEKVFGYRREELVGRPIETLIPDRFAQEHPGHRARFVRDPRARTMGAGRNVFGLRKDGSEVPVEIGLSPIRTVDGLFVVASVIDISERRRAEAETLGLRQELAHISRVAIVGELTAAIVHELGQPLTAIMSNAQAGLRMIASGDHEMKDVREILEDIVADDQRASGVIRHLRSLFKKGEADRRPLALATVINEVVSVVGGDASLRNITVETDLALRVPLVSGDRVQLQQVLLNLVVNAFDAMEAVTERPRRVALRMSAPDETGVHIEVGDTGPGIAPERLGSIFEPFVTTKPGGMGMGLSVSHTIIRAHEGRLWAENNAGGGATFHIVLPALREGGGQ